MRITALTSSIRLITPSGRLSFHDDDDDEELCSLFDKEQGVEQLDGEKFSSSTARNPAARRRAVEWIVKVINHHEFSTLTAVLAINYLDRFIAGPCYEKPWTIQLVVVGCLSLAAKVEETDVPLLLDLQIDEMRYLFEAKTIQRVELLILSELGWRMHPVTPVSFIDHIVQRMRLKGNAHWNFLSRCHRLLLCLLSDARSVRYRPSVLATATVMHVTDQVDHFNSIESQAQLLSVLNISKVCCSSSSTFLSP
ncbi:CYCD3-1 [Linum perenne]